MNRFTLEQARTALKAAVDTQGPDFVYQKGSDSEGLAACFYRPLVVEDGIAEDDPRVKTGCLIGTALKILGATDEDLRSIEKMRATIIAPRWTDQLAANYFGVAQGKQDHGETWGAAYQAAEQSLGW